MSPFEIIIMGVLMGLLTLTVMSDHCSFEHLGWYLLLVLLMLQIEMFYPALARRVGVLAHNCRENIRTMFPMLMVLLDFYQCPDVLLLSTPHEEPPTDDDDDNGTLSQNHHTIVVVESWDLE